MRAGNRHTTSADTFAGASDHTLTLGPFGNTELNDNGRKDTHLG